MVKRITLIALGAMVCGLAFAGVAAAQESSLLGGKFRTGDNVTIPASETIEGDLYAAAGTIRIDGVVTGDLVVAGGDVDVAGTVGGDLLVGAGSVDVSGVVEGDIRAGVGRLSLPGTVSEDLIIGAGQVSIGGRVGGDVVFGSGQMNLSGSVDGDLTGQTGAYSNTGTVEGIEDVTIDQGAADDVRPSPVASAVGSFASLFLLGLALIWLTKRRLDLILSGIVDSPGAVIGAGVVFVVGLIAVPLAATIAGAIIAILFAWLGLDLLVGLTVALLVLVWVLTVVIGVVMLGAIAPITFGTWVASLVVPANTPLYLTMAAGVLILVLVGLVPFLGAVVGLVVTVVGSGAWVRRWRTLGRNHEMVTAVP